MERQSRNLTHCEDVYGVRGLSEKLFFSLKVTSYKIREREREEFCENFVKNHTKIHQNKH